MLRFALLGSGSSGNALLITTPHTKILIDNGFSFKQLQLRVAALGETLEGLRAVFVTHEHADHVNGLGVLTRRIDVPVYLTEATYNSLPASVGPIPRVELFEAGDSIAVNGLTLTSFSVSHDAADPACFVVESSGARLGIASDLGHASHLVKARLAGAHGLVLESNYCPEMLRRGPYPPALKQRIQGKQGHLSNVDMNSLLAGLLHDSLQVVVLAHLSKDNNTPEQARKMAAQVLGDHPAALHVAAREKPTPLLEIRA